MTRSGGASSALPRSLSASSGPPAAWPFGASARRGRSGGAGSADVLGVVVDDDLDLVVGSVIIVILEGRLEDLEVAQESRADTLGQRPRHVRIADRLAQVAHLCDEVGLLAVGQCLDPEASSADRHEVEAAVRVAAGIADDGRRPDARDPAVERSGLSPLADEDDAEWLAGLDAVIDHPAVALLEDVERQRDAWAEDRVEGKERQFHDWRAV